MRLLRTILIAVTAACALTLTACSGASDTPEAKSEPTSGPMHDFDDAAEGLSEVTPPPVYTAAQKSLVDDSRFEWTGDPEVLFDTADKACTFYRGGKTFMETRDMLDDELTRGPYLARQFLVDVMRTVCTPETQAQRAEFKYQSGLLDFADHVEDSPYGYFVSTDDALQDAPSFCAAGARGDSYNDIAGRIRRDYFEMERRVQDYIGRAFDMVCPQSRVAYTPPPPPPAATNFYSGTYRVSYTGKNNVQPGTYAANTAGDGCYWERNSSTGAIIDNYFGNGLRVQVTIYEADYSFNSERCGHWRKVG